MRKEDLTIPGIIAEAVGLILGVLYVVLQISYGVIYHVPPYRFVCNIAGCILVYTGLTMLSCQPEKINRIPAEMCVGQIRRDSIRMILTIKLAFIVGLMIPCVCDVIGYELKDAYSLLVVAAILLAAFFYEYRILRTIRKHKQDPKD